MRRHVSAVAVAFLIFSTVSWAKNYIVPTTTLSAQINNNTSAANGFPTLSDGNLGAGNVSKVDVHSLLYAGATTKVYAHLLLWFGGSNHMNVGYGSTDPNQIHRQITDMISRGIDGVIIDWYGPGNSIDQATQLVMAEAEKHPGFTFAIMVDQGALEWDSCSGCTPQQALIEQLRYIEQTYVPSPAYMRIQGLPVITNFNIDLSYSIDWNAVNSALSIPPKFLFQNDNGFTHTLSDGSYSWVMPTTTDYGMSYLTNFYHTGMSYPAMNTVGAAYKGFNDTLASWGSNRIMAQQCGQTWLQTFAKINALYSSDNPLPYVQLVTWNDYEEGTEIESGIDNCVSISASVSGNGLQWGINGSESAIDHYTIYISTDGQNLMALSEEAPGNSSLNLCSFDVPPGSYKLFVQAVGKPSLANRIIGPINYQSTCNVTNGGGGGGGSSISFGASPAARTIQPGQTANFTVTATAESGTFSNPIALTCNNLPGTLSCSFSPNSIIPNSGIASSTLTISAASGAIGAKLGTARLIYGMWLFPFGFGGLVLTGWRRGNLVRGFVTICLVGSAMTLISCGTASQVTQLSHPAPVQTYSVTVAGNSGSMQFSTVISVSVP
jgi:hypothetical protein